MTPAYMLLVALMTALLLAGDYAIKIAVGHKHPAIILTIATIFWAASIPGWYAVMLHNRYSITVMMFSVLSLVGTAIIGTFAFQEKLSPTEWTGFGLAIIATVLLSGKTS